MDQLGGWFERAKNCIVPVHTSGYAWIAAAAGGSLLLALLSETLGFLGLLVTLYLLAAFRNPTRIVPTEPSVVIAPADGVVRAITEVKPPPSLELGDDVLQRVTIQTGVFDVQLQRIPASGKVITSVHVPGSFSDAYTERAAEENERQLTAIATDEGLKLGLVQIGSVTGRMVTSDLRTENHVKRGEPFGMVRFAGRVDVYLPKASEVSVLIGQRMVAGETVIAKFVVV